MDGCAAINCCNHSRSGFRMVAFPRDSERRKKWIINCRRKNWEPRRSAQLCIAHFEESRFELHRQDGWKRLKLTAVPTIFDVPNPPQNLSNKRKKGIGLPKPGTLLDRTSTASKSEDLPHYSQTQNIPDTSSAKQSAIMTVILPSNEETATAETESTAALMRRVAELEAENQKLKKEVQENKESLSFLSEEQISNARKNPNAVTLWSDAGIIKGFKLRFQLRKTGYNYLRNTKYPSPSYSTLNRRMQGIKVDFGVINSLMTLLQTKVEAMDENDRMCCISIDEMEISGIKDFDNIGKKFVGNVTLGPKGVTGNNYTGVLLPGFKTRWEQIVAHEITGPSTNGSDMKKLTLSTIQAATAVGLKVKAIVSDMGSNSKALWNALGVNVTRSDRNTSFSADTETIHVLADPLHLLKNICSAFLSHVLTLLEDICKAHDLPSKNVSSSFLKVLWEIEQNSKDGLRSLHHLHKEHLFPSHFGKMNVTTAVQLFSLKTAAALEKAVRLIQVPTQGCANHCMVDTSNA